MLESTSRAPRLLEIEERDVATRARVQRLTDKIHLRSLSAKALSSSSLDCCDEEFQSLVLHFSPK